MSAIQMAGVVAALLLGAGAVYGVCRGGAAVWHRRMLERAIPGVLAGMRTQREGLIEVIETYKSRFGFYPPLLTSAGPARGVLNPLCYELLGAQFNPKALTFHIPVTKDALSVEEVQKYFKMSSFSNSLPFPALPTNFLANRPQAVAPLEKDADVFGLSLSYTEFTPESFWEDFEFTPWRYANNPADHNSGKFDLWVEVTVAGKHFTIGNWPEAK